MTITNAAKRVLHVFGLDLRRLTPKTNARFQLLLALQLVDIELVVDIGANIGQFAEGLRVVGYTGRIVSFEPLSKAHRLLLAKSRSDPRWTVHSRTAIGEKDGQIEINIAANSVSSSLLPMLKAHVDASDDSGYVGTETTAIARLDSVS